MLRMRRTRRLLESLVVLVALAVDSKLVRVVPAQGWILLLLPQQALPPAQP